MQPAVVMLLCVALCLQALAGLTRIHEPRTLLSDGVYRLSARFDIHLSQRVHRALENGVPLLFDIQIEVTKQREWLWADTVAQLSKKFGLQYHALTRKYLVDDYSSGANLSFPDLDTAISYIGNIYDLPLIDEKLLNPGQEYRVRMRAVLDVESLPTPLRLQAYFSSDWSLDSDWYEWILTP